jgi:hypothetical protein
LYNTNATTGKEVVIILYVLLVCTQLGGNIVCLSDDKRYPDIRACHADAPRKLAEIRKQPSSPPGVMVSLKEADVDSFGKK